MVQIASSKYYPIGTVVTLVGGSKPIMIYGRKQFQSTTGDIWDYVACLYPEGNIDFNHNIFFHHNEIDKVLFLGYSTEEDMEIQKELDTFIETYK